MTSQPPQLDEIRSRVEQLKHEFPEADEQAIRSFVCDSIDFEQHLEGARLPRKSTARPGLWAALCRWWQNRFAK